VIPANADPIKWVNFDVPYESLKYAMDTDIATAEQEAAAKNQGYVDAMVEWAAKYEVFLAEYEKAVNVALWGEDLAASPIYTLLKDGETAQAKMPTFTYFYDNATETFTIIVSSAKDANQKAAW
jgi:hypothetical protein